MNPTKSKATARKSTVARKKTPSPKMPEEESMNSGPGPPVMDDESSSSDRPSPLLLVNDDRPPPVLERMVSLTSSSASPVPARSKSPDNNNPTPNLNIVNEESNPDSISNDPTTITSEAANTAINNNNNRRSRRKINAPNIVDETNILDEALREGGRRRGSRQLTKVRAMDKELAAWINGFHADNKLDELTREMITERAREIAKQKKILDFSGTANWYTRFLGRNFSDSQVSKQLKMLSFANPGKFMEDFDPERSAREMRKMNRRIYRENVKKNQMYDESGRMLDNSKDVCDCLDEDCPGCHFPCPKCGSEKCGTECRCNRKWVYEIVEIEGSNLVIKNPCMP